MDNADYTVGRLMDWLMANIDGWTLKDFAGVTGTFQVSGRYITLKGIGDGSVKLYPHGGLKVLPAGYPKYGKCQFGFHGLADAEILSQQFKIVGVLTVKGQSPVRGNMVFRLDAFECSVMGRKAGAPAYDSGVMDLLTASLDKRAKENEVSEQASKRAK